MSGFVFYDENGNGVADPAETVRLPSVGVTVGGVSASTAAGRPLLAAERAERRPDGPGAARRAARLLHPGRRRSAWRVPPSRRRRGAGGAGPRQPRAKPNVYLAFGDSITWGQGSVRRLRLRATCSQADLRALWGKAEVTRDGVPGTKSNKGESRLGASLSTHRPAYLLILYGTNDWNDAECRDEFPCYTIDALRSMVLQARDAGAFPVVGTIPPVNPSYADRDAGRSGTTG